jgi:hypothetical protein
MHRLDLHNELRRKVITMGVPKWRRTIISNDDLTFR